MCRVLVVYIIRVEALVGACARVCACVWKSEVTLGCCSTRDIHPTIRLGFLLFEVRSLTCEVLPIRLVGWEVPAKHLSLPLYRRNYNCATISISLTL